MGKPEKAFAKKLRELRGSEGQQGFSERVGIPYSTYQKMESGLHMPQARNRHKIAQKLGLSVDELFGGDPTDELRTAVLSALFPALDDRKIKHLLTFAHSLEAAAVKIKMPNKAINDGDD